jgi:hypothetical protein
MACIRNAKSHLLQGKAYQAQNNKTAESAAA